MKNDYFKEQAMQHLKFPVSKSAPFLSNLNILDNLSLVLEHKVSFMHPHYKETILKKLALFGLENLAYKHHSTVSEHDYFVVQLIRASLVDRGFILIDTPFYQVSLVKDVSMFVEMFARLGVQVHNIEFVDYVSEELKYEEGQCHIEKCLLA